MLKDTISESLTDVQTAAKRLRDKLAEADGTLPDRAAAAVLLELDKIGGRLDKLA